jgi:transposase
MAHQLSRLVYHMLNYGERYVNKGMNYYEEKYRHQEIRGIQKKATQLGLRIALSPAA